MDWSGVDYCDVLISCLDSRSDGTHSLQTIRLWASDVMLHFSKSVPMKKHTHLHVQPQGVLVFISGWTVSSSLTSWEGETATRVWIPTLGHSQCDGSVNVNNSADITLILSLMRVRDITTSPSYPGLWTISRSTLTASSLLMFSKLISFTYNKTSSSEKSQTTSMIRNILPYKSNRPAGACRQAQCVRQQPLHHPSWWSRCRFLHRPSRYSARLY